MAKVGTLIKTAKFAGKILGGVATAAGIYEGAKIVGNGVTAGLDALRTRGAQPPPAPPTSNEPVAGEDYAWTGGPDEYWTGAAPVIKKGSRKEVAAIKKLKDEMDSAYQFAKNAIANLEKVKADLAQLQNSPPTSLSALTKLDEFNEKIASLKKLVQIGTDKAQVAKLKYNQAKAKYEAAFKAYFVKYGVQPDFSVVAGAASDAYEEMTSDPTGVGPEDWTGASDDASAQHAYLVSAREKVASSWPESREKQEALADLDRQIARHARTVGGYDSPLVAEARTCVGASEGAYDEDAVSGSYDCSDAGKAAHMDKILARGFSRPYAAARVDSWRDLVGCNGPQAQEEMRAAVQQLQSEGQSPRQAQSAVVTAATRMRLQGQAPVQGNPVYGHYGVYGADEYWNVGAAPSAIRARGQEPGAAPPAASAPQDSKKLRELEDKLTILNFEKTTLERESRDATKAVNTAERDVKEAEKTMGKAPKAFAAQGAVNTGILLKADKGLKAAKATLEAAKKASEDKKRALENKTKEIETQKSLITAEKQAIKSKADAEEAKRKGDTAKALAEQKAAATAKQLSKVTEELNKKVAEAENAAKQAKTDGEKAVLEAKVAALQEQASNMAKLAASPKETEKVAQAPSETGLIISSLLQAVLQKNASPQEVAAKVEQGQTPAPTAPMMSFNEMDELYIEESDDSAEPEALSGGEACCDACRQGLSCSGDSCPVGKAPCAGSGGHEHGHDHPHDDVLAGADAIPWATHWASASAPEWADGIFEGGPGIPSYVSKESCSTGSCRLPK